MRELVEQRTALSEWWLNDDGTITKLSFDRPKFFDAGGGRFALIDTTVIADKGRPGSFVNTAGAQTFTFSPIGGNGAGGVEVTAPGRAAIRFWPSFAQPASKNGVAPTVGVGAKANVVTYTDVAPGVDLVYTVQPGGLSERIVLRAPTKTADWVFEVEGASLQPKKDAAGKDAANVFESADPADGFVLPGAIVIDPNGEPRHGANNATVQHADPLGDRPAKTVGGPATKVSKFTVGVDAVWLASLSAKDFPVIIDPTVTDTGTYRTAFQSTGYSPGLNAFAESFAGVNPAGDIWRSYVQFGNFKDPYATTTYIADAHLDLTSSLGWEFDQTSPVEVHDATAYDWWNWSFTSMNATVVGSASLADHASIDVTGLVRAWLGERVVVWGGGVQRQRVDDEHEEGVLRDARHDL